MRDKIDAIGKEKMRRQADDSIPMIYTGFKLICISVPTLIEI